MSSSDAAREPAQFERDLQRALAGATRIAVLGIGDDLNPLDRPGILAAILIHALERPNVTVFLAGTMPENFTGGLRELGPSHVVMIDAAEMGLPPGSVGLLHPAQVRGQRFSTHAMPLTLVIEYVDKEIGARVVLVGVQPDAVAPAEEEETALSPAVIAGLRNLQAAFLKATRGMW
jgi:hydrogenase 3 maturation protease